MKSVKQMVMVLLTAAAVIGAFSGCKSTDGATADRITLKSSANVQTIEHKGTALGVNTLPQWLAEWTDRGIPGVESLADYKGKYCIVADERGTELQQLLTWVNNFNAQQQIGAQIETRVASVFKANESKVPESADSQRKYSNAINTLVSATYTGARKESDWWVHQRIVEKGKPDEIRYTAYVLYSIDRKILDEQIAASIAKIKDGTPELDRLFDEITAQILESGLQW
ncbi:hypothetical protein AGMMS50268_11890 [Spirochaetia bacterium]|nr:hypothetical protein AGMMS49546_03140 [Spirochaetia bacterium]GHV90686.1 hypothetical protein AGMMS50268_11890 [Spirochaetia bacterium]